MILVRSKRASERVRESIATFIESRLHLKVNREKTEVAYMVLEEGWHKVQEPYEMWHRQMEGLAMG